MTAYVTADDGLLTTVRQHLEGGRVEQVGFFLADFDEAVRCFRLREWRPMPPDAFEIQTGYHVTLKDEVRPELIKWAWDAGGCLAEIHSHGMLGDACFSPSDLRGFASWVPHVRWRLRARPYLAVVADGDTFDALAWIDPSGEPVQVDRMLTDSEELRMTGLTLARGHEKDDGWA